MWRGVVERACLGQCTAMKFSGVDTALYVGVTDSEPPSLYIKSRKLLLLSARLRRRPARGWTVKPPQRRPLIHINIFGIPLLLLNSASYKLSFPLIIRTTFDLSGRPRARHRAALPLAARPIVHHVLTHPGKEVMTKALTPLGASTSHISNVKMSESRLREHVSGRSRNLASVTRCVVSPIPSFIRSKYAFG